jgi:hypothetical protein
VKLPGVWGKLAGDTHERTKRGGHLQAFSGSGSFSEVTVMSGRRKKRASALQQVAAFVGIILAIGGGLLIGMFFSGGLGTGEPAEPKEEVFNLGKMFIEIFAGVFFLGAAAVVYGLTVLTQGFTFSYQRPVFSGFKMRLFVINIIVLVGLILGGIFIGGAVLGPVLASVGLPPKIGAVILTFVVFLPTVLIGIWTPMDRPLVTKRLRVKEVPERAIEKGQLMGLSYPKKSTLTKFSSTLDDVGMLWILKSRIIYRGDNDEFEIRREDLVDVERKTDRASPATVGGGVPIILTFRQKGEERKIRLLPQGTWTVWGLARALDDLAEKIDQWREAGDADRSPAEPSATANEEEPSEPNSVPE